MKNLRWLVGALALGLGAVTVMLSPARALSVGENAPDFKADSTLNGRPAPFHLKEALARQAVVLYFFPKAFTAG